MYVGNQVTPLYVLYVVKNNQLSCIVNTKARHKNDIRLYIGILLTTPINLNPLYVQFSLGNFDL